MQQFIQEANIRLLEAKLAETTDAQERVVIQRLLAQEKAKPIIPTNNPRPDPSGKRKE